MTAPRLNQIPIVCPRCRTTDKPGAKPMIEINNGSVTCIGCGHSWVPQPPKEAA